MNHQVIIKVLAFGAGLLLTACQSSDQQVMTAQDSTLEQIQATLLAIAASPSTCADTSPVMSPGAKPSIAEASATEAAFPSPKPTVDTNAARPALVANVLSMYERKIATALRNIAHMNSPGYKKRIVHYDSSLDAANFVVPEFSQGVLEITQRNLDVAIQGHGLFQVIDNRGELCYTRESSFHISRDSEIVTSMGFRLRPYIKLPRDLIELIIDERGEIFGRTASSPSSTTVFGQIELARFINPEALHDEGRGLWSQTGDSGTPKLSAPGAQGIGTTRQGFIERSNVELFAELVKLRYARANRQRFMDSIGLD